MLQFLQASSILTSCSLSWIKVWFFDECSTINARGTQSALSSTVGEGLQHRTAKVNCLLCLQIIICKLSCKGQKRRLFRQCPHDCWVCEQAKQVSRLLNSMATHSLRLATYLCPLCELQLIDRPSFHLKGARSIHPSMFVKKALGSMPNLDFFCCLFVSASAKQLCVWFSGFPHLPDIAASWHAAGGPILALSIFVCNSGTLLLCIAAEAATATGDAMMGVNYVGKLWILLPQNLDIHCPCGRFSVVRMTRIRQAIW